MGKGRSQNNQVAQEAGNTRSMDFLLRHKALLTHVRFKALSIGPDNNEMMSYVTLEQRSYKCTIYNAFNIGLVI